MNRRGVLSIAAGGVAVFAALGVALFFLGEFHRLSAIQQHPRWVYAGLSVVRDTVVSIRARDVGLPADFAPEAGPTGARLFDAHCRACHGAPGVAPDDFALGMMPVPPPLVETARERPPEQIYWFIRNGLKMSGMPAWHLRLTEAEMWRITAFVEAMPLLTRADWLDLVAAPGDDSARVAEARTGAAEDGPHDAERGRIAMQVHACRSCHVIPGMVGDPDVRVGPPLGDVAARRYIGGVLPNRGDALARWIADPRAADPMSLMPDLGVPLPLARDMAAYLRTLSSSNSVERDVPSESSR